MEFLVKNFQVSKFVMNFGFLREGTVHVDFLEGTFIRES